MKKWSTVGGFPKFLNMKGKDGTKDLLFSRNYHILR